MLDINLLDEDILEFITYINVELLQGRDMKDIEKNDFFVNDRVIVKRLARRRYKRAPNTADIVDINGNLIKIFTEEDDSKTFELQPKEIVPDEDSDSRSSVVRDDKGIIYNEDIKSNELLELINRKEEIFKVLDYFNNMSDKVGEIGKGLIIKLPNARNNEFKATIRLNDVVWEEFKDFSKKNPFFEMKDLTSQALVEFMNKYK